MRKSILLLAVPTMAILLAVTAVAFVPGMLSGTSPGLAATSIAAPGWKVGDAWTYNVSMASVRAGEFLPHEMAMPPTIPSEETFDGTFTETVAGTASTVDGTAWNVTFHGEFGAIPPLPIVVGAPLVQGTSGPAFTLSGFAWLRQSDLAPIYTMKSVHLERTWTYSANVSGYQGMISNATYALSFDATTQTSYAPALAVFQFPLEENRTWSVQSNATIRYASTFRVSGPNVSLEANHSANFTVPLRFSVHTGFFENVTTPAGTFRALPVSASRSSLDARVPDGDASAVMNLTSCEDLGFPHPFATAWFSAQTGGIVKVSFWTSPVFGPRVEVELVSYAYG
jgi:hypothetical protein